MTEIAGLAAIFDHQGRVLLVHQTYGQRVWSFPGGRAESGEAPWSAAIREVKEETGLDVEIVRLASVYYFSDRDGLGFHFLCRVVGGALQVDGREISEAAFFDPEHLPVPMMQPGRQRLVDILANCDQPFLRVYDRVETIRE